MTRTLAFTLCVFTVGLLTGVVIVHGQAPDWDPDAALVGGVRCLNPKQDLGEVWLTDEWSVQFHFANESTDETFEVGPVRGNCICTRVEPESFTLGPGEEQTVRAVINLQKALPSVAQTATFTETLSALARTPLGEAYPLNLEAKAVVRQSYRIAPGAVDFGRRIRGKGETRIVEMTSLGGEPLQGLEVISCPEWVDVKGTLSDRDPAAGVLSVGLMDTAGPGVLRGVIRVRGISKGGPFASRSVPVSAVVYEDIIALPSAILFGTMPRGSEGAAVVTLQSQRQKAFTVQRVACDPGWLEADVVDRPTPSSAQVRVVVQGKEPGTLDGICTFSLRTESGHQQELTLRVRGIVLAGGDATVAGSAVRRSKAAGSVGMSDL
jgi:hypothetical protein